MLIRRDAAAARSLLTRNLETVRPAEQKAPIARAPDMFKSSIAPAKLNRLFSVDALLPKNTGDKRTIDEAIPQADDLLLGGVVELDENGAEVTRDAPNVNDMLDTFGLFSRARAAKAQVEANSELEAAQVAKLSEADRKKYEAVKQTCIDASDPVAQLALQKLLLEGELPGEMDLAGEGTTLDHLAALADPNTPLAEGVDRNRLVTDLVQEIATPSAISQGPRGTCAPTTIAIELALEHPAEYARIAAGLASPEGTVVLAGGQTLTREPDTAADDRLGRSTVQRLMGPAFMEMANGDEDYDNATDEGAGAWSDKLDLLYDQVMGANMSEQHLSTEEQQAGAMDIIDAEVRAGGTVPVALSWGEGYHKVLVTGTETVDGEEYVKYINPWGREERMLRTEFEGRLADISYDPVKRVTGGALIAIDQLFGRTPKNDERQTQTERGRRAMVAV